MSIEQKNKIDFISIRKSSGTVVLTISDHLDWEETSKHLEILQNKLNSYISFIESGQIFENYPQSRGKSIVIEIVSKEVYPHDGLEFILKARPIIKSIGADLRVVW